MSKVDQFESVFRSAITDVYTYERIEFNRILIISDLAEDDADAFAGSIKKFAKCIHIHEKAEWVYIEQKDFTSTHELLMRVVSLNPNLIFTYRNLHSNAWQYPHSLGEHLDVLIQKTDIPVVVLPNPHAGFAQDHAMIDTNVVMAITDVLTNDHELVNYAVRLTEDNGDLYLVHIEDADTFEKYMNVISKIATIETDDAREKISSQLQKAPHVYIESVKSVLEQEHTALTVHEIIRYGHHLTKIQEYIDRYKVDLLVMNSKDKQQMAMHGLAYPLAVELRQIPLLMI